jgi:hypothetical protein
MARGQIKGDGSQEEREEDTRDETRNYPNYLRRSGLEEDFIISLPRCQLMTNQDRNKSRNPVFIS